MNRDQLVRKIATDAQLSRKQAGAALDSFVDAVQMSLVEGSRVTLSGFGTFVTAQRKSRVVRDPRRGTALRIAARRVARFVPGLELKMAIANLATTEPHLSDQDHTGNTRPSG